MEVSKAIIQPIINGRSASQIDIIAEENLFHQNQKDVEPEVPQETQKPREGSKWILFAFGACACFTACNAAISEITSKAGPACIFYFASGSIVTGLVYNI